MNDLSEVVERLATKIEALDRRVAALEDPARPAARLTPQTALAAPSYTAESLTAMGSGTFSVLGKAMLGIAGAYVFRALVESAILPRTSVIAVAIAYALLWLIPATRGPDKAGFSTVVWAGTSALILVPMLWELTMRFRILPSAVAAAILCAFVLAASGLAWKHHFAVVAGVANGAASMAALALAVATRDLVPFMAALLLIAIVAEAAAARSRTLRVRPLVAAAADVAAFVLIWVYSSTPAPRPDYPLVSPLFLLAFAPALLFIYGAGASMQTIVLRRGISVFETAQALIAALLALWAILSFWPGHGALVAGALCLLAAAAGYAVAFAWFDRRHALRNYRVYATGSLALLLIGCILCLPHGWLSLCLGLCAMAALALAAATARYALQVHGLALLAAAAVSSGLLRYVSDAWIGPSVAAPGWIVAFVSIAATVCYASQHRYAVDRWWGLLHHLLFAGLAVAVVATLVVWILVRLTSLSVAPGAEHLAVIRTLVACATALALAWLGSLWRQRDLMWLAWIALAFAAFKLLFEDLRHGHLGFTAASIFLFAVTLLLVPRLLHSQRRALP